MKFTFRYVIENRYNKNANPVRKLGDRFVVMTVITKRLSPFPVFLLLNLGLHPDAITLMSLIFIIFSTVSLILGQGVLAVIFMFCFAMFDSIDGDMARCIGPTKYGGVFDSFGADLFYALIPTAVGYYLFVDGVTAAGLNPMQILLVSFLISISFLLYRLINVKVLNFRQGLENRDENHSQVAKTALKSKGLTRLLELYRHVLVRGNFFAEPGLVFWFSVLILCQAHKLLVWYLLIVLLYNLGYLVMNFFGTYVFFRSLGKKTAPIQ